MKTHTLCFRDNTICYKTSGQGRAVFLLHGFLGKAELFTTLQTQLASSYRVIAPDLPGHGESASYGYVHSMELMAEVIHAIARAHNLRRYVLVGHSMGGYVALSYFNRYPQCVAGIFLLNSTSKADSDIKKIERSRALEALNANKTIFTSQTLHALFAPGWPEAHPNVFTSVLQAAQCMKTPAIAAALRGMKDRHSGFDWITRCEIPLGYGIGKLDRTLAPEELTAQCNSLKRGFAYYFNTTAHYSYLEAPVEVHRALRNFLRKCF
ncbi:MAG: alpha/beta fold hydrolase [Bacteroidia bacterium]